MGGGSCLDGRIFTRPICLLPGYTSMGMDSQSPIFRRFGYSEGKGATDDSVVPVKVRGESFVPIGMLVDPAIMAPPETTVQEVKDMFGEDEPINAVVIVEDDKPIGLVMSLHLDKVLSHQFGVALYYRKPVSKIMDREPMFVQCDIPLEIVAGRAMQRDRAKIFDHIIVMDGEVLAGTVPIPRILETLAVLEHERTHELICLNARLQQEVLERKTASVALQESREMLKLVIDSLPQSIFWKDVRLNYLGCNMNFAREAGCGSAGEVIGKNDQVLSWQEGEAASFRTWDLKVIEANAPHCQTLDRPGENGQPTIFEIRRIPMRDRSGNIVGILGCHEDITEKELHTRRYRPTGPSRSSWPI